MAKFAVHATLPAAFRYEMDFITHSLMGVAVARLAVPRRMWRPQYCLAGVLGSLLQDGDSWLHLLGPNFYGKYHRVISHSFVGLAVIGTLAGVLAWTIAMKPAWRRFGWFVLPNLPAALYPSRAPVLWLICTAVTAAYVHWCADVITGFGNMLAFWPWHHHDFSLKAVTSFDLIVFSLTLTLHILTRTLDLPRRREALAVSAYVGILTVYIAARVMWGEPTFILEVLVQEILAAQFDNGLPLVSMANEMQQNAQSSAALHNR
jgi:membrane-bound metal-dependent hydrolase YbcI (DUF457 family)